MRFVPLFALLCALSCLTAYAAPDFGGIEDVDDLFPDEESEGIIVMLDSVDAFADEHFRVTLDSIASENYTVTSLTLPIEYDADVFEFVRMDSVYAIEASDADGKITLSFNAENGANPLLATNLCFLTFRARTGVESGTYPLTIDKNNASIEALSDKSFYFHFIDGDVALSERTVEADWLFFANFAQLRIVPLGETEEIESLSGIVTGSKIRAEVELDGVELENYRRRTQARGFGTIVDVFLTVYDSKGSMIDLKHCDIDLGSAQSTYFREYTFNIPENTTLGSMKVILVQNPQLMPLTFASELTT